MELRGTEGADFDLVTPEGTARVELALPGLYNVYNALAAATVCRAVGIALEDVAAGLGRARPAFGRFERIDLDGRTLLLLLIKNPAGANEALRTLCASVPAGAPKLAWMLSVAARFPLRTARRSLHIASSAAASRTSTST